MPSLLKAALTHHKNGELEAALQAYEELLQYDLNPSITSTIASNAGAIEMVNGDYESARVWFLKGVEAQPENGGAHYNLAITLTSKLGSHEEALRHVEIAGNLGYDMVKVNHLKGNILQDLGRHQEAEQCYTLAELTSKVMMEGLENSKDKKVSQEINIKVKDLKEGEVVEVDVTGQVYSLKCLSVRPLVLHARGLVSDEECDHVIRRSRSRLEKSLVMGGTVTYEEGSEVSEIDEVKSKDPYRFSYNAWLPRDEVLENIQDRIAALSG